MQRQHLVIVLCVFGSLFFDCRPIHLSYASWEFQKYQKMFN